MFQLKRKNTRHILGNMSVSLIAIQPAQDLHCSRSGFNLLSCSETVHETTDCDDLRNLIKYLYLRYL